MAQAFKKAGVAAARACSDKKGGEISLIHTGPVSPVSDYLLIVTALSGAHLKALENEVRLSLKTFGLMCLHRARPDSQQWRVLDYGGIVIHLMTEESREFYALEKLYPDSPRVRWAKNSSKPRKASPRKKTNARSH